MPALVPVTLAVSLGKVILSGLASDPPESGKSAAAKKSESHDASTGTANSANTFAAFLAAATVPPPVVPLAASATPGIGLKGSTNTVKGVASGEWRVASEDSLHSPLATRHSPLTAAATVKPATPTPTAAGSVKLAASSIRPGSPVQTPAGSDGSAKTSTVSPVRTAQGSATPSVLPADHEQPGVNEAAPSLLNLHAPTLQGGAEESNVSVASVAAAPVSSEVRAPAAAPVEVRNDIPLSAFVPGQSNLTLSQTEGTVGRSGEPSRTSAVGRSGEPSRTAGGARLAAPTSDSPPRSNALSQGPIVAGSVGAPATATPTLSGTAHANLPVADQLTQAFVAHADVARNDGRIDFHLRLEPPQLGTVQIHLSATDHTISARVVVAQEATRQLLDGQAHHLRQSLAQAGLSLTGFDVSRDGGGSRGGQQPPPQPSLPAAVVSAPAPTRPALPLSAPARTATNGIDILA